MSIYVGIQDYNDSLTNIVTNGLLTSNITGWTSNSYFNYSYDNCTQLTVKTAQSGTTLRPIYQSISISGSTASTNQVLYAQATVKGSSSNSSSSWPIVYLRSYLNGGTSASQVYLQPYENTLNDNQWHTISLRVSTYVSSSEYYNYDRICFSIKPPLVLNDTCYYKNIILINLTEKFGRGNEPTKEWCDEHIFVLDNIIPDGNMESSSWSGGNYSTTEKLFGSRSQYFPANSTTIQTISTPTMPVVGHKYYGRHYLKTDGNVTAADCRFEWYAGDGPGLNFVFGWNQGNYPNWTMESSIVTVDAVNGSSYMCRSFDVNNTGAVWADGLMIVDLTEAFGSGNEPTKQWCDENIPFFTRPDGYIGYIIPGSVAIKMNRLFVGVNNVARKVKKAYIGINGIARKFFGPILKYIGTTTSTLSSYKCDLASAVTGNYALFAGGLYEYDNDGYSATAVNTVDAYNNTLIKSTPSNLDTQVEGLAGVSFNNYALFGGGKSNAALYPIQTTVNVYNNSLSKLTSVALSTRRHYLNGGKIGNYALFAGGYQVNITNTYLNSIDAFDTSLVLIDPAPDSLSEKKRQFATAQSSNYLLFAGGQTSDSNLLSTVDAYNTSLVKTTCTDLSVGRPLLAGTVIDNIYLFAGGGSSSVGNTSVIDVYNSLIKTDSLSLSVARYGLTGVVIDEYIIFAGGANRTTNPVRTYAVDVVDVFNKQLISISGYSLSSVKGDLASAVIGNYALFAGGTRSTYDGYDSGGNYSSNTVDVFQVYY